MENIIALVGTIILLGFVGIVIRFANNVKYLLSRINTLDDSVLTEELKNIKKVLSLNCENAQYREQEEIFDTVLGSVEDWPSLNEVIAQTDRDISYVMPWTSVPEYDNTVVLKKNREETINDIDVYMSV